MLQPNHYNTLHHTVAREGINYKFLFFGFGFDENGWPFFNFFFEVVNEVDGRQNTL